MPLAAACTGNQQMHPFLAFKAARMNPTREGHHKAEPLGALTDCHACSFEIRAKQPTRAFVEIHMVSLLLIARNLS
jgi:hypothetical protein